MTNKLYVGHGVLWKPNTLDFRKQSRKKKFASIKTMATMTSIFALKPLSKFLMPLMPTSC